MIAAVLWLELLLEVGVYCVLIGYWGRDNWGRDMNMRGWMLPLLVSVAFVMLRAGAVLASCIFAWSRESKGETLSVRARLGLLFWETIALVRFFLSMLYAPRRREAIDMTDAVSKAHGTLVVLLHGVYCNRAVWRPLIRRLRSAGNITVLAPNLIPVYADLDTQAKRFAAWLDAVAPPDAGRVVLIGHSMGGLIARLCTAKAMTRTPIHGIVCIGAPHRGSALARIVPGKVGRDLRFHSRVLSAACLAKQTAAASILNIYSNNDNLIVPAGSARLEGARNHPLRGVGHLSLVYSSAVWERILRELQAA